MTKTPAKYTQKPVTITAVQWTGSYTERPVIRATQIIKWILENGGTARYVDRGEDHPLRYKEEIEGEYEGKLYPYRSAPPFIVIKTLEADHRMDLHDWAIMGVEGEFYPCKPRIFSKTYDPAVEGGFDDTKHLGSYGSELR